jgi:hypothetical protein
MPLIALIAALVMRGQERIQARREFLRNWAFGSAAWLCTGWLIALIALGSAAAGAASCQGGIDQTVPPTYASNDGTHWTGTFACMNGGTITKPVPVGSAVPAMPRRPVRAGLRNGPGRWLTARAGRPGSG